MDTMVMLGIVALLVVAAIAFVPVWACCAMAGRMSDLEETSQLAAPGD